MKNHDPVNSPSHYCSSPSGIECIQITEHMNFNVGNAVKYLWRADHKNGIEDLRKAAWYIVREIKRLEKLRLNSKCGKAEDIIGCCPATENSSYYSVNESPHNTQEQTEKEAARIRENKNYMLSRVKVCPKCQSADLVSINTDYYRCYKCSYELPKYATRELEIGEFK